MEHDDAAEDDSQQTHEEQAIIEDLTNQLKNKRENHREMLEAVEDMDERIDEIRAEMIHPEAVQLVLKQTGISETKTTELVETMQEVDRRL